MAPISPKVRRNFDQGMGKWYEVQACTLASLKWSECKLMSDTQSNMIRKYDTGCASDSRDAMFFKLQENMIVLGTQCWQLSGISLASIRIDFFLVSFRTSNITLLIPW